MARRGVVKRRRARLSLALTLGLKRTYRREMPKKSPGEMPGPGETLLPPWCVHTKQPRILADLSIAVPNLCYPATREDGLRVLPGRGAP
jgi:hypothetical protein